MRYSSYDNTYYDSTNRILQKYKNNSIKPFLRRRLYEDVVNEIGLRIISGAYQAGDILPSEENLVEEFGVSRTVVREAVKVLTEKGLLQPRPKLGTAIYPRNQWNLLDSDVLNWELQAGQQELLLNKVTEARRIIEPEAAALAAQRASDGQIAQMIKSFDEMVYAAEHFESHAQDYIDSDMVFHAVILNACGNELLEQMANMMRNALVASRQVTTAIPGKAAAAIPAHRAVLHAIQQRDSEAAYRTMQALIDRAKADIEEAFRQLKEIDG